MRYSGILIYQGRKVVSVMLHNFDHINEDLQIISDVSLQKDQSRIRIMNFFIFIGKFICCSTSFKKLKDSQKKLRRKIFVGDSIKSRFGGRLVQEMMIL